MLFHNCADRNLNLDLTASLPFTLSRHTGLYKDPCKIISKFVDFDVPTESDRYIGDLSIDEDIEKEIQVDFFDNLKTPSEELKGFTPIDESNPLVSGLIAAVAAYNNSSISSTSHFDSTILSKTNSLTVPASSSTPSVSSLSSPSQSPSPSPSPNSSLVTNDIEMGDERKSSLPHHLSHLQVKQTQANNDSLMTPIIDPNSSLANNGPHFPSFDVNSDNVFGQYLQELTQSVSCENDTRHLQQDVKPNFSLMPSTLAYSGGVRQQQQQHQHHQLEQTSLSSSTPSLHHIHQNQNQTQTQSNESGLDSNRSSSHMYSLGASTQHDFEYPTTLPGISGYSNRSAVCDVEPNMGIGTPSSLTPSSSTSSMSYAELKPRSYSFSQPSTSILTESMVPTVIEDHPYTSRHNTSSPFGGQPSFSPPSSCPSNSSLNSTTDQRDSSRDLFCLINGSDFSSSSRKRNSNQHEASSRRGRLTKKEKLDKMITEEKRLESENTMLKEQLRVMEHQFKVLQTKITNILIDAAKRKG